MGRFIDMTGMRYNRLQVLSIAGKDPGGRYLWLCRCDCGKEVIVEGNNLRSGHSKSCRCLSTEQIVEFNISHGMSKTPTHICWLSMINRCYNPNNTGYKNYGGRGIKVCDRWLESFENFFEDMGERPNGLTIERINNGGDYSPENCKWATRKEQSNNSRHNRVITLNGKTQNLQQWREELKIPKGTLQSRITRGKSHEEAILQGQSTKRKRN